MSKSIWSVPAECAGLAPNQQRPVGDNRPQVVVRWDRPEGTLYAFLEHMRGKVRVVKFEIVSHSDDAGVPEEMRRLPSDGEVIEAVLRLDLGAEILAWLSESLHIITDRVGQDNLHDQSVIEKEMRLQARGLRPRNDRRRSSSAVIGAEVAWVRERIETGGGPTKQLVQDIMTTFRVTQPTAFRRLRDARAEIAVGSTHG